MASERTRTLLFGLFIVAGRDSLTAPEIIALASSVGLTATNVRSHLTRLVARGDLERSGPPRQARYRPARRKEKSVSGIRFRLDLDEREAWRGDWALLALRPPVGRRERAAIVRRLRFDGFARAADWTFARPAWPRRWALARVELHRASTHGLALSGALIGEFDVAAAKKLYPIADLERSARRVSKLLDERERSARSAEHALARRLRLGGLVARTIATDPILPPTLWGGPDPMRALARRYRLFEARLAAKSAPVIARALGSSDVRPPTMIALPL